MESKVIGEKYSKIADWWSNKHINSNYGIPEIIRAIKYCENKKEALDVGCGSGGRIINKLLESGFKVTALDVSEKMLDIAKRNHSEVSFYLSDICEWNNNKKFDLIIAWDSIFHLPLEKQEFVISKLCSYLNKNGIIIYTFGDDYGDHEDLSFSDSNGNQIEGLNNDYFGYGTIGIYENIRVLKDNHCKCVHLEMDQYPFKHVFIIGKKE